jgi:hypothetical protein
MAARVAGNRAGGYAVRQSDEGTERLVIRLLIAVAIGAVLAVGVSYVLGDVLLAAANGTPANGQLFNYGSH